MSTRPGVNAGCRKPGYHSLLKESGGKAASAGGEGADCIVVMMAYAGVCLDREDFSENLAADLVAHVLRVGKCANVAVVPQAQDHAQVMLTMQSKPASPARKAA